MAGKRTTPGESALRRGRRSLANQGYFITFTSYRRTRWFRDWEAGWAMSSLLHTPGRWPGAQLLAWVLMPDHWHGILVIDEGVELGSLMKAAKGSSSREFNRILSRRAAVWGPGFHDRAIRQEEGLRAAARYLVANPVRAGLVASVGDYPFWDAVWVCDETPV